MEENNNVQPPVVEQSSIQDDQKPKKKVPIIIIVLLVIVALGVGGYICYDKFIAKKPETNNNQKENEKPKTGLKCEGYKTFTKYTSDNNYFYNLCLKEEIDEYSSNIKIVYDLDDMDLGFYQYADSETYERRDEELSKNLITKTITNKKDSDLITFGRLYAESSGNIAENFLLLYTDMFDSKTCVSKEFLEKLSNQIYGKAGIFVKELFVSDDPYHGDNMYCLGTHGFGPGENFKYVSKNGSDSKMTIKYKNVSDWDDMKGRAYATISFELKDGFWIITNYSLGDN